MAEADQSAPTPPADSSVRFSPDQIKGYGKLLADVAERLRAVRGEIITREDFGTDAFGAFRTSRRAANRCRRVMTSEVDFLDDLRRQAGAMADSTLELARDYANIEDANASLGQKINS